MKITVNELRSLVKQVIRETEEENIGLDINSSMKNFLENNSPSEILKFMAKWYDNNGEPEIGGLFNSYSFKMKNAISGMNKMKNM